MGIPAYIYDSDSGRDPLSVFPQDASRVLVINSDGPFEEKPGSNPVKLIVRNLWGRNVIHAAPVDADGNELPGVMKGYSFIASSDSRFQEACEKLLGHGFYGAVALHDRLEG